MCPLIITDESCRIGYRGEMQNNDLAAWLVAECERRNLSWAEASRRANVSPNTISDAVAGTSIGPKRLLALAEFFETPPESVFRMAGILPPLPDNDGASPEVQAAGAELIAVWQRIWEKDRATAEKLINIGLTQADAFEAAVNAATRHMEQQEEQTE